MLWFIGLGISGLDGISVDALKILRNAKMIYIENFTSPIGKQELAKIKKFVMGKVMLTPRWMVEDGKVILADAKKRNVVLLSYGDPYVATTHIELRVRAEKEKIKTNTIHGTSAITALIGECGLHHYKLGRLVTIMREFQSLATVYNTIYENILKGNHSLLILEYDADADFFMDPKEALKRLWSMEKEQKQNILEDSTFTIVASRIGKRNQKIIAGRLSTLVNINFGNPPHTVIIPGKLHFTEQDALKTFSKCLDEPSDNSLKIQKKSDQMLSKYIPKARIALNEVIREFGNEKNMQPVIENANLYLDDAEKFQEDGKEELAILSVGYAEGLLDALRLSKGIDPWAQSL